MVLDEGVVDVSDKVVVNYVLNLAHASDGSKHSDVTLQVTVVFYLSNSHYQDLNHGGDIRQISRTKSTQSRPVKMMQTMDIGLQFIDANLKFQILVRCVSILLINCHLVVIPKHLIMWFLFNELNPLQHFVDVLVDCLDIENFKLEHLVNLLPQLRREVCPSIVFRNFVRVILKSILGLLYPHELHFLLRLHLLVVNLNLFSLI